jgi:hypothetical protein
MDESEDARKHEGSRPESDTARKRELRIAPEKEILKQTDKHEINRPKGSEAKQPFPVQDDVTERECVRLVQCNDHHTNCDKAPQSTHPEPTPKGLPSRQTAGTPWAAFDANED